MLRIAEIRDAGLGVVARVHEVADAIAVPIELFDDPADVFADNRIRASGERIRTDQAAVGLQKD